MDGGGGVAQTPTGLSVYPTAFEPDLVAIGMRNVQNTDYSGMTNIVNYYKELMATIRESTTAPRGRRPWPW